MSWNYSYQLSLNKPAKIALLEIIEWLKQNHHLVNALFSCIQYPPPSTYGSGAGTKIEKIIELCSPFKQILFIFEVIKWQWIPVIP